MSESVFLPVLRNDQSSKDEDAYYVIGGDGENKFIAPFGYFYKKVAPTDYETGKELRNKSKITDNTLVFKMVNKSERFIHQLSENEQLYIHKDTLERMLYGGARKRTYRRRPSRKYKIAKKRTIRTHRRRKSNRHYSK
jgi:hypothetical protein